MNHCAGGPATDQFDLLAPLVAWVEQGVAPGQADEATRELWASLDDEVRERVHLGVHGARSAMPALGEHGALRKASDARPELAQKGP